MSKPKAPSSVVGFFEEGTAIRLLGLDPQAFHAKTDAAQWWVWKTLVDWEGCPERPRYGWGDINLPKMDGWAALVIESMPDEAFDGPEAQEGWRALLGLGLGHACAAFAKRVPGQWLAKGKSGQPLLREPKVKGVWEFLLADGVDPFAPMKTPGASPRPLWRAVLPENSKTPPAQGSLRSQVEDWISNLMAQGHPSSGDFLRYRARWLAAWLGHEGSAQSREVPWTQVEALLAAQPVQWLAVRLPQPAWTQPFFNPNPGRRERWAQYLARSPGLKEQTGPLGSSCWPCSRTRAWKKFRTTFDVA